MTNLLKVSIQMLWGRERNYREVLAIGTYEGSKRVKENKESRIEHFT